MLLEAAASGLPIITSRSCNGVAELLTEGVDGYLLSDPANDEELAGRLRALMDASRRQRMGEAARQMALKHPFSRNFDELMALYREVARVSSRAA